MPPNPTLAELTEEEALHYRTMIRKLADMAMNLAANIHDEALTPPTPNTPKPDHTIPFDRISRTIRRCILLAHKLAEPPRPTTTKPYPTPARKRILRAVEDTIQREAEGEEAKDLHRELLDRLDAPDLEEEIATRPIESIIEDICRDLGIAHFPGTHPWSRRTPQDIAILRARARHEPEPEPGPIPKPRTSPPENRQSLIELAKLLSGT